MLKAVLDTHLNDFHLEMNLSAEPGKTTVLLGESGAGKSTVLRLLAGLLHPQQGHISLDDTTYFDSERHICIPPQERPFGYVFQDYAPVPHNYRAGSSSGSPLPAPWHCTLNSFF